MRITVIKKVRVLHCFPADHVNNISRLKCLLEGKEIELQACKKVSHAKTLQIQMLEKSLCGM